MSEFKLILSQNQEQELINQLKCGLIEACKEIEEIFTINGIIGDLSNYTDLLNVFTKHLKIEDKEFFEIDKSLLDKPIKETARLITFAGKNLFELVQENLKEIEKREKQWEEDRLEDEELDKEFTEEKIKILHSNITFSNVKVIKNFDQFLNELGFSDNEKDLIKEVEFNFDSDADLSLMNIHYQYERHLDYLNQSFDNLNNEEDIKYVNAQIKCLKKFLKICPEEMYV